MKCEKCGYVFEGIFCPECGTKANEEINTTVENTSGVQYVSNENYKAENRERAEQPPRVMNGNTKAFAIVSLIFGICSLVCMCCSFLGSICGIVAIITAIIHRNKDTYKKFGKMALAGLICGIIGTIGGAMFTVIMIIAELA